MEPSETHDNFPVWIIILSNLVSILIYSSGVLIIFRLGWIAAIFYLLYIIALEYRLISKHCVNCYYWGRMCGFGKGRLSALFFMKGEPAKFCSTKMSWKDMIPDLLVFLLPFITGIALMIIKFDFILLLYVIILIVSATTGNSLIRGKLTCRYCRQREIGCTAETLFREEKNEK